MICRMVSRPRSHLLCRSRARARNPHSAPANTENRVSCCCSGVILSGVASPSHAILVRKILPGLLFRTLRGVVITVLRCPCFGSAPTPFFPRLRGKRRNIKPSAAPDQAEIHQGGACLIDPRGNRGNLVGLVGIDDGEFDLRRAFEEGRDRR